MDDELVDIISESGKILRQASKHEAHKHGWLHKTVIGCVRNGTNWKFVRQAGFKQDAGQLVNPVGGHVKAGESDEEAIVRETREEIGSEIANLKLIGNKRFHRQILGRDENHLFVIYELTLKGKVTLGDEAVQIVEHSDKEYITMLKNSTDTFGDAHLFVMEHFFPDHLPKHYEFRWATTKP